MLFIPVLSVITVLEPGPHMHTLILMVITEPRHSFNCVFYNLDCNSAKLGANSLIN